MRARELKIPTKRGMWHIERYFGWTPLQYAFIRHHASGGNIVDLRAVPTWIRKKAAIWLKQNP